MNEHNISAIYPLSPLQQGILFRNIYDPESVAYVAQFVCKLCGELDAGVLRQAWQQVVDRHAILRTAFVWEGVDEPLQVVGTRVNLPWEEHDWRELPSSEQQERLEEYLLNDRRPGFDPTRAPLMRLSLVRLSNAESAFVWTHHHLLLDGWSTSLLMKEVSELYQALQSGDRAPRSQPRPYGDYIAWLRGLDLSAAESYWRKALDGFSAPTPLGVDSNSLTALVEEKGYELHDDCLSAPETRALERVARQQRLTLNTLIQGAWALVLSLYSGSDDVVFGSVVSGRPAELAAVETMIGMFINTLAVRVRVPPEALLSQWLRDLQTEQAEARRYEYSSLTEVQGWSGMPRGQAMFESVLVFANYPVATVGENQSARIEVRDVRLHERTDVPLTVEAAPGPELRLRVMYDTQRFDERTASRIMGHLKTVLVAMSGGLEGRVADLPILTAEEREELVSRTTGPLQCGPDRLLHQLFEAAADTDPRAPAISFDGDVLTYGELNTKSNQIARGLRGLAGGRPVAIMLDDGPVQIAAMLGVVKAGCPFVFLDRNYPSARVLQIVAELEPACLLADVDSLLLHARVLSQSQQDPGVTIVSLDEREDGNKLSGLAEVVDGASWFKIYPAPNPDVAVSPTDLAYIAFTSGSTGRPKGIMQSHRSFCQFLRWQSDYFGIRKGKRVALWASLTYDASYRGIFGALCFGATVCMTTRAKRYDPVALVDWVREERITLLNMVPTFCRQLLETVNAQHKGVENPWPDLEHVSLAGEALTADLARAWLRRFAGVNRLCNLYGPTECVLASYYPVTDMKEAQRSVPIGRPIEGRQLLILDPVGRLCPIGVVGEIHIRSPYLTCGYWRRPQETEQAFLQNPLHDDFPDPVYRTGDLGRWLPDGNVEFRGRKDQQIKLRGMRIEIDEIEYAIRQHELVGEAAVAAHRYDDMDLRLVAYVRLKSQDTQDGREISAAEGPEEESNIEVRLRTFLKELLPEQMVPASFVFSDALPRTRTGKLDRKALLKPDVQRRIGRPFVAPRTPLESLIADILRELLKVDRISVDDNFFELGGHSILATRAVNRVKEKCFAELSLRTFLESPTVADVARHIEMGQQLVMTDPKMLQLLDSVKQLTAEEAGALVRNNRERA